MLDYDKALEYATQKHMGQKRIGGEEYITHPYAVSQLVEEKGYGLPYKIAALFHDLLEDTDATEEEILELSDFEVLEAIKLLTKKEGYVMEEYIANIFRNDIACVVKQADRLHNLRESICCSNEFKIKYVKETVKYYYPLIKGKDFEKEIVEATEVIANMVK